MKKVLFIAYYFPPCGGAGVQRSAKFVNHLSDFGWLPVVITAGMAPVDHWSPPDESLSDEIPAEVSVYRCDTFHAPGQGRWNRRLRNFLGLREPFAQFWQSAILELGIRACQQHRPDLILITIPPYQGVEAAATLAERMRLPLVADLRDPWALDEKEVYPSGFHRKLEQGRMRRALYAADAIVMNTPEAASRLHALWPEFRNKQIACITNGFDAADFKEFKRQPNLEQFTIVHTGSFFTALNSELRRKQRINGLLRRVTRGMDFLSHSPHFLLQAIQRWSSSTPGLGNQIRLIFVGAPTEDDKRLVRDSGVESLVKFTGYLSHRESVAWLAKADLLFLPMYNLCNGQRATIVPAKTYEYMASGKPILAALPGGDARDFVTQAGTALVCQPSDIDGMVGILGRQYKAWSEQRDTVSWNKSFVEQFERRRLTKKLAAEFDKVTVARRKK